MIEHTQDYLINKQIKVLQPVKGYRVSTDAIFLSSLIHNLKADEKILDVGSGTGGISLCLAHRFPQNQIYGLELQPELAELSNSSAQINNFVNLTYLNHDIREKKCPLAFCSFDRVATNPPYSDHDMPSPNHSKATAHNHSGINLSGWLQFCLKMLKPFGYLYMINRVEALNETIEFLKGKAGNIQIIPIYSKPGQDAKRIMIIAQKESKTPTKILPPFYVFGEDNEHTAKTHQILREGKSFFDACHLGKQKNT